MLTNQICVQFNRDTVFFLLSSKTGCYLLTLKKTNKKNNQQKKNRMPVIHNRLIYLLFVQLGFFGVAPGTSEASNNSADEVIYICLPFFLLYSVFFLLGVAGYDCCIPIKAMFCFRQSKPTPSSPMWRSPMITMCGGRASQRSPPRTSSIGRVKSGHLRMCVFFLKHMLTHSRS